MKFLISGLGSIGKRHLRNLVALGEKDIILYRTKNEPLTDHLGLPVYTDLAEALAQKPDAVLVCNPTAFHLDVAITAAEAGCHLFIEKPLSHTWDRVPELLELVREKNLVTQMGYHLRFDIGLGNIKRDIQELTLGQIRNVVAYCGQYLPDWHPGEDYRKGVSALILMGGGVINDLSHEIDYLMWFLGMPKSVYCVAKKLSNLEIETEDVASLIFEFEGTVVTVNLNYLCSPKIRHCWLYGDNGSGLWFEGMTEYFPYSKFTPEENNKCYIRELEYFLATIKSEKPLINDVFQGAKVLKVILAAKESAATGKVVAL